METWKQQHQPEAGGLHVCLQVTEGQEADLVVVQLEG